MIVAPTEPAVIREAGTRVSTLPERYGVDVLWGSATSGLVGVQRKEFPGDFLASVVDGRLAKEVAQMRGLDIRVLVLEGRATWTTEGQLVTSWGQAWTKTAHRRYLCSLAAEGVWVFSTDNVDDTVTFLRDLHAWTRKPEHRALRTRPGAKRDRWGRVSSRAYQLHLIQGIDGVGPELAERILDTIGMPFGLRVTEEDLLRVHGIGPRTARRIVETFREPNDGQVGG